MGGRQTGVRYSVVLKNRAKEDLEKVDKGLTDRIIKKIGDLEQAPYSGKALKGRLKGFYSLRAGKHRMIYRIEKQQERIIVERIQHRSKAYK